MNYLAGIIVFGICVILGLWFDFDKWNMAVQAVFVLIGVILMIFFSWILSGEDEDDDVSLMNDE